MFNKEYLAGKKAKLVRFTSRHITPGYISWINDSEVNRYMVMGRIPVTKDEVTIPNTLKTILFAIMAIPDDADIPVYIGTSTIHNIDWINGKAEIGFMIGNKEYWGCGIATEVISLMTEYAFQRLGLSKLNADAIRSNVGSVKALEKNGFFCFGVDKMDYYLEGEWHDNLMYYKLRDGSR